VIAADQLIGERIRCRNDRRRWVEGDERRLVGTDGFLTEQSGESGERTGLGGWRRVEWVERDKCVDVRDVGWRGVVRVGRSVSARRGES
jgi:hypothetical protein